MLVLTRKSGQAIVIDGSIEVFVVEVRGDQVRLGIRAPRSVSVVRSEVLEQVRAENQEAAGAGLDILDALAGVKPAAENTASAAAPEGRKEK